MKQFFVFWSATDYFLCFFFNTMKGGEKSHFINVQGSELRP